MDTVGHADPVQPTDEASNQSSGCLATVLFVLALLGCACAGIYAPFFLADFWGSGSATGAAALDRAHALVGDVDHGQWRSVATDARAAWTAPDFHGDQIEYVGFTLPPEAAPRFEQFLRASWAVVVDASESAGPRRHMPGPGGGNVPGWFEEPLEDAAFFRRGLETVGISRKSGRVLVIRFEQ